MKPGKINHRSRFDPIRVADRPEKHIGHQLPQPLYLEFTHRALWEYLGMLWAMLRPLPAPPSP
jgi:hypothetical protein